MSQAIVSKYKDNSIAGAKRHSYARLMDYFLTLITSMVLFVILNSLAFNLPFVRDISNRLSQASIDANNYIDASGIQKFNDDESGLLSIEKMGEIWIANLTKTSAYYHDLDYPYKNEDNTYTERKVELAETFLNEPSNYALDNIGYFYKVFRLNEAGLEYPEGTDINHYLYEEIMDMDASKCISEDDANFVPYKDDVSHFLILNLESTQKMIRRVGRGEEIDSVAVDLYNNLGKSYVAATQQGITDVENNSVAFKAIYASFNTAYQQLSKVVVGSYYIAYLLSYVLLMFIGFFMSKKWITIGQKVMKLALTDMKEMEPSFVKMILYHLMSLILFSSGSVIAMMLTGMFGVMAVMVIPYISLLAINLFIIPFNLFSMGLIIFGKRSHHDISTFVSRLYVKDTLEFDVKVEEVSEDKVDE